MSLGIAYVVVQFGVTLALTSAALFGVGTMTARRALIGADILEGSTATVIVGLPILLAASAISGEFSRLSEMTMTAAVSLGLAGLANFFVGRLVMFKAIQLVGANRTHSLTTPAPVYASLLAVVFLQETVTAFTVAAIIAIIFGTYLLSRSGNTVSSLKISQEEFKSGVTLAMLSSVLFGLAHFLTGLGVESVPLPITGAVVSYVFAALGYLAVFASTRTGREHTVQTASRRTLRAFALPGIFNGFALIFAYSAFAVSPVVLVSPVLSTQSLFTVFFSYLVIRKLEVFHKSVILGALLVVLGVMLLYLPGLG